MTEPTLDRRVTLTFQGDWGQANLHRVCGWLSQELGDRSAPGSRFFIRNGRGGTDAIDNVLSGEVDVAIMTPTAAMGMVAAGVGPLAVDGAHRLRALGTLPQRDRLITCVDAALGVSSINELANRLPELRIATSPDDGVNLIGLAAHRQLRAVGVEPTAVRDAGGEFFYDECPFPPIAAFRDGAANVLIHEAIMTPHWQRITDNKHVVYLDACARGTQCIRSVALAIGRGSQGLPARAGPRPDGTRILRLPRAVHRNLADDVASLIAWCMVATRDALEVAVPPYPA